MPMLFENFQSSVLKSAQKKQVDPVIVFTGKRNISANDKKYLNALGALLSENCPDFLFRAGNQIGADIEFIAQINPDRLQIVPPYASHREDNIPNGAHVCPLDKISVPMAAKTYFKNNEKGLYDAYMAGERHRIFQKSRYLMRNLAMLYGFEKNGLNYPQASILIYWDDLAKPKQGGTGFTVAAAKAKGVSTLGQKIWQKWL